MPIEVRLGGPDDVAEAASVYERSNLARRRGVWPSRAARLQQVIENLRDEASWFLIGRDGEDTVAMASVLPFRADQGMGPVVPETAFLDLIFVLADRWGEGIGGLVLDAVITESAWRGSRRIYLWTHEDDNERAHRLYAGRGFRLTGVISTDDSGSPVAEWRWDAISRDQGAGAWP